MQLSNRVPTFCYFGIYQPRWARDTVLLEGLKRQGAELFFVMDDSPGIRKYFKLISRYLNLANKHDYVLVGYLSNIVVPLVRLLTTRPVIFNAGNSMYEGSVLDRGHRSWFKKERYIWLVDWLALHLAQVIIVETKAQKYFMCELFGVLPDKFVVLPTGADDQVFFPEAVEKRPGFWVVFRSWFVPATGVEYVLAAAEHLAKCGVNFLLIGRGFQLKLVEKIIVREKLTNVELITEFVSDQKLRQLILSCHVMLGQFSKHERLDRTIQNKTYEALALGMPYITRDSASNREWLVDQVHCLFTKPADSADLTAKILFLKDNPLQRNHLGQKARILYEQQFTPQAIASRLLRFLSTRH